MKHFRKSFLTLLALTLFGGAGAWAQQGPTQVTLLTTDMVADWQGVTMNVTLADLQALDLGFVAVDESVAQAWTGAPQEAELAYLIYGFSESDSYISFNYIMYNYGNVVQHGQSGFSKAGFYLEVRDYKVFYTGSQAIELTKSGANQWTLGQTPDYDVELQVEYYDQYTLDSIPMGWQVKVGNAAPVYPTAYTEGNTTLGHLTITETDSVELIPPADVKPNVKNVTLVEPVTVQTVTIGNVTLQVVEGETWEAIVDRNSGVIIKDGSMIMRLSDGWYLIAGGNWVNTSDQYNSTANYSWEAMW